VTRHGQADSIRASVGATVFIGSTDAVILETCNAFSVFALRKNAGLTTAATFAISLTLATFERAGEALGVIVGTAAFDATTSSCATVVCVVTAVPVLSTQNANVFALRFAAFRGTGLTTIRLFLALVSRSSTDVGRFRSWGRRNGGLRLDAHERTFLQKDKRVNTVVKHIHDAKLDQIGLCLCPSHGSQWHTVTSEERGCLCVGIVHVASVSDQEIVYGHWLLINRGNVVVYLIAIEKYTHDIAMYCFLLLLKVKVLERAKDIVHRDGSNIVNVAFKLNSEHSRVQGPSILL
jgi:hypothetical protein